VNFLVIRKEIRAYRATSLSVAVTGGETMIVLVGHGSAGIGHRPTFDICYAISGLSDRLIVVCGL